mgnify:CR=1 FL=1
MLVLGTQDFIDDIAVICEQDQAFRIFIEASDMEYPEGMVDQIDNIPLDAFFGRARDADRFVQGNVDIVTGYEKLVTVYANIIVTRPSVISLSAPRREAVPASLINLLIRMWTLPSSKVF